MRPIIYGLAASFFFSATFIFNRSMDLQGGSWVWSAALRFFFMLPMLLLLVAGRKNLRTALTHLRANLKQYLIWSTIGFGFFYAPSCIAAAHGEAWLVAATWQITIIAGPLLTPFLLPKNKNLAPVPFYKQIPFKAMRWSLLILLGVFLMQLQRAHAISVQEALLCVIPSTFAAFMWPLGNRKMMEICHNQVDTFQRVLNMTIASLPFWLLLSLWGGFVYPMPSSGQIVQTGLVALSSGVIATLLFFGATNLVKQDVSRLAAVEATQSGEVIFALAGEIILLSGVIPSPISFVGMSLVMLGMVLHSLRKH